MIAIDASRFVTADVGGEIFLLDQQSGESFQIGGAGARLWSLFKDGKTTTEAAGIVADETRTNYERVLTDARAFVVALRENGVDAGT